MPIRERWTICIFGEVWETPATTALGRPIHGGIDVVYKICTQREPYNVHTFIPLLPSTCDMKNRLFEKLQVIGRDAVPRLGSSVQYQSSKFRNLARTLQPLHLSRITCIKPSDFSQDHSARYYPPFVVRMEVLIHQHPALLGRHCPSALDNFAYGETASALRTLEGFLHSYQTTNIFLEVDIVAAGG